MGKLTTEQILKRLLQERGTAYFREGDYFVNAVKDLGDTKEDVTLLRYLVKSGGVQALLDVGGKPPAMRQTVYSQTVERVCKDSLISPELSHKVCGIFWRAVYNEEPPITPQKKMTSEPEKSQESSEPSVPSELDIRISQLREELTEERKADSSSVEITEEKAEPIPQRRNNTKLLALVKKIHFFRPEHTRRQRILLMLGWGLLLFETLKGVNSYLLDLDLWVAWAIMVSILCIPTAYTQFCLWNFRCSLVGLIPFVGLKLVFMIYPLISSLSSIFTGDLSDFSFALYLSLNMVYLLLGWKEVFTA